jgi:hypothetical protein
MLTGFIEEVESSTLTIAEMIKRINSEGGFIHGSTLLRGTDGTDTIINMGEKKEFAE